MDMLSLAMQASLPLVYVRTDDVLHVEEVLTHYAGEQTKGVILPEVIKSVADLKLPADCRVFFTSSECKSMSKLYRFCEENGKTIVFVNTDKSVLQFEAGTLVAPKDLVLKFLLTIVDQEDAEALLPAFGGLTLKDVIEVSKLTMTRDAGMSVRGVNDTRKGYLGKLKGLNQVDTNIDFYLCPAFLTAWMAKNKKFFLQDIHQSLVPRGLLFDGPPGTGKTLGAKFIADELGVPLYRIDLGGVKSKYVGDSENNLIAALQQVDEFAPCVVIFDEVEKVFQSQSDSGVTSSLLSQLLWWLQEHKSKVFTVMTTNDVSKIPAELHREGRIDETLMFNGLESFTDGYEFARGAFESMAEQVELKTLPDHFKALSSRVKVLFADEPYVSQAKVTNEVYSLIKDVLTEEK